ncbi:hypothetical protein E5D57_004254 [Metarhizium anisopliae]|nr:hypothetical protein E5D57_004254 [Metarhizium anisopliae]
MTLARLLTAKALTQDKKPRSDSDAIDCMGQNLFLWQQQKKRDGCFLCPELAQNGSNWWMDECVAWAFASGWLYYLALELEQACAWTNT